MIAEIVPAPPAAARRAARAPPPPAAAAPPRALHAGADRAPPPLLARLARGACSLTLAAALALHPAPALAAPAADAAPAVDDRARLLQPVRRAALRAQLADLEAATGWRVRVLTRYGVAGPLDAPALRAQWRVDDKTLVVMADPGTPNALQFFPGARVPLSRDFLSELQARFGNLFFVRANGADEALLEAADVLDLCLRRPGGCVGVPGLPAGQRGFTFGAAVAGGVILGTALRIDPRGRVTARWQYGALFAPLWAPLAGIFSLGPILNRTEGAEQQALLGANLAATAVAVLVVYWGREVAVKAGLITNAPARFAVQEAPLKAPPQAEEPPADAADADAPPDDAAP
jgi:hypothetical protein